MNTQTFLPTLVTVLSVATASANSLLDFGPNTLDFGNSTFYSTGMNSGNTASDGGQFRWANIIDVDGRILDLTAEVSGGTYNFPNAANNGIFGEFGQINIDNSTSVEFTFTLVDTETNNAVEANLWNFAVFDIDSNNLKNLESFTLVNDGSFESYTVTDNTELAIGGSIDNPSFSATTHGVGADNPSDPKSLTIQQENRAVLLTLANTSTFKMRYETTKGNSGRNFLFAGDAEFSQSTTTVTTGSPTQVVTTAVPEPSSSMLLLGASLGFIIRRKRK